jgi:hypothetical protein
MNDSNFPFIINAAMNSGRDRDTSLARQILWWMDNKFKYLLHTSFELFVPLNS